jgi:hypothetical protein
MAPPEKILLARIHSGTMKLGRKHGPPELVGPGGVAAYGALDGERFSGTCHRGHWDTFLIDSAFLGHVAGGPAACRRPDTPHRLGAGVSDSQPTSCRGDGLCA